MDPFENPMLKSVRDAELLRNFNLMQSSRVCGKCQSNLPVSEFNRKKDGELYKFCKQCMMWINEQKQQKGKFCPGCKQHKFFSEFIDPQNPVYVKAMCNWCSEKVNNYKRQLDQGQVQALNPAAAVPAQHAQIEDFLRA